MLVLNFVSTLASLSTVYTRSVIKTKSYVREKKTNKYSLTFFLLFQTKWITYRKLFSIMALKKAKQSVLKISQKFQNIGTFRLLRPSGWDLSLNKFFTHSFIIEPESRPSCLWNEDFTHMWSSMALRSGKSDTTQSSQSRGPNDRPWGCL